MDILFAAEDALLGAAGTTEEEFGSNRLKRYAILHCLTLIGEASARIEKLGATGLPDLPWPAMRGLRNVIVHEYEDVDTARIWRIVVEELPIVIEKLDPLFPEREKR